MQQPLTSEVYARVWAALQEWIASTLKAGKGVSIPALGQVRLVRDSQRGQPILAPRFQASEAFCKAYSSRPATAPSGQPVGLEDLNPLKLAMCYSTGLDKAVVAVCLKHILQEFGHQTSLGKRVRCRQITCAWLGRRCMLPFRAVIIQYDSQSTVAGNASCS